MFASFSPHAWDNLTPPVEYSLTCIATGDPRLPPAAYPLLCRVLDKLLARRVPSVRLVYCWRSRGTDSLVGKYCRERKLAFHLVADRRPEVIATVKANALVVFDGGGKECEALLRQARAERIPVRVIDVRAYVVPARS